MVRYFNWFFLSIAIFFSTEVHSQSISINNAFAHNDYWHKRPLFDALNYGYTYMEADVYLRGNKLVVAHILPQLRHHKDLENLYLRPLYECITRINQSANYNGNPITLMIDVKSDAGKTYQAIETLLTKYKSILSGIENGVYTQRQLTIVISGNKPSRDFLEKEASRMAFLDDDLINTKRDTSAREVYRMASCKYSRLLHWSGSGQFPLAEQKRLCAFVNNAHMFGEKVRLWASPEKRAVWRALLNCGVDLINTDKLAELRNFLVSEKSMHAASQTDNLPVHTHL